MFVLTSLFWIRWLWIVMSDFYWKEHIFNIGSCEWSIFLQFIALKQYYAISTKIGKSHPSTFVRIVYCHLFLSYLQYHEYKRGRHFNYMCVYVTSISPCFKYIEILMIICQYWQLIDGLYNLLQTYLFCLFFRRSYTWLNYCL